MNGSAFAFKTISILQKQRSPRYAGFFLGCLELGFGLRFAFLGLCGSGGVPSIRRSTSSITRGASVRLDGFIQKARLPHFIWDQ